MVNLSSILLPTDVEEENKEEDEDDEEEFILFYWAKYIHFIPLERRFLRISYSEHSIRYSLRARNLLLYVVGTYI